MDEALVLAAIEFGTICLPQGILIKLMLRLFVNSEAFSRVASVNFVGRVPGIRVSMARCEGESTVSHTHTFPHVVDLCSVIVAPMQGVAWRRDSCVVFLQPTGGGPGRPPAVSDGSQSTAGAALTVQQGRSLAAGGVLLRLSCSCWVYNCTGLPLGVRAYAAPLGEEGGHGEPLVRHQMGSWVSPFLPSNLGHARHARPDAPRAAHPWNTKSPKAGLRSTTDLADTDPAVVLLPRASARRQHRLGFSGTLGASDEGSAGTAAEVGVPWPGMLSSGTPEEGLGLGVPSPEGSVLVELSAGCSTDPEMWSIAAAVGHLGIPAIAEVALPEWYRAEGAHLPPGSLQVRSTSLRYTGRG